MTGPIDLDEQALVRLGTALQRRTPAKLRAYMAALDADNVTVAERALAHVTRSGWRSSPSAMAGHLDPTYKRWPFVELLASNFVDAFRGIDPHQIWNLPSQYGKTTGLVWGVVWALDFNPRLRIMYVSYDADRAVDEGGKARDIAEQHADQLSFRLRADRRARGMWRTTEGGGLYCVGVNGAITGFPADALLLDDLIKGWQAAHSEAQRKFVMNVYRSQIRMRVQSNRNPIIVTGTRWHMEDPSGQLAVDAEKSTQADQFKITRLPALAELPDPRNPDPLLRLPDPLGRQPGEPLEEDRFPKEEVLTRAVTLGSYLAAAMEQQRPAPEEGGEILRKWWQWADQAPPRFDDCLTSWDTKLKDKTGGDYVVGQAWGRTGSDFWCIDQLRGQWNLVYVKTAIVLMAVRHPRIRRHVIENAGNGPEVMEQLRRPQPGYTVSDEVRSALGISEAELPKVNARFRRGMTGLVPETPKGDKRARLRAQAPLIEAGNVHLLTQPWADSLVNEAAAFPNGVNDDQVDALSQALKKLSHGTARAQNPTGSLKPPPPGQRTTAGPGGRNGAGRAGRTVQQPNRARVLRPR